MRTHSDVVIIGGGAVGTSIVYHLAINGASVTIVERDSIASHASGFSGGLLNPTSEIGKLVPLHHQSFRMHEEMLDDPELHQAAIDAIRESRSAEAGWWEAIDTAAHAQEMLADRLLAERAADIHAFVLQAQFANHPHDFLHIDRTGAAINLQHILSLIYR